MRNKEPLTKEEIKINRVGGYLEETLTGLISYLDRIDQYALEPLSKLGFTSDLETYLYWAHKNPFAVTKGYVSKEIDKIATKIENEIQKRDEENGNGDYSGIPIIEKYAKSSTGKNKGRIFDSEILHNGEKLRRKLTQKNVQKYNKIAKDALYKKVNWGYGYRYEPILKSIAEDIFFDAIELSETDGLTVNKAKFIEIFEDYTKAKESKLYKAHTEIVDAINKFFGCIPITDKELSKYFMLEYGIMKINPKSVNLESYMRINSKFYEK